MPNSKKTTISLSEETKELLAQFEQKKGESFDEILQRIIKNVGTLCHRQSTNDDVDDSEEE